MAYHNHFVLILCIFIYNKVQIILADAGHRLLLPHNSFYSHFIFRLSELLALLSDGNGSSAACTRHKKPIEVQSQSQIAKYIIERSSP